MVTPRRRRRSPFCASLIGVGIGMRLAMTPVTLAVIDALPAERAGMGSALNATF